MATAHIFAGLAFLGTGLVLVAFGYHVWMTKRADLVVPPVGAASKRRRARVGGQATIAVGCVTAGLGLAVPLVAPAGADWLWLVGGYALVCLAIGVESQRLLRDGPS